MRLCEMHQLLLLTFALLMGWVTANDDVQYIKSVKGSHGGVDSHFRQFNNFSSFYGNQTQYGYGGMRTNFTVPKIDFEVGVCYIEVPTASLVRDPKNVPAGNGSNPELSRIRTCCRGYIRNIHNFKICDPVCTEECVNALCTAPDICTCFPDHTKNLAGYCIPTCPIGCQNGHCSGGECLCEEGYKLDSESRFCIPKCHENCGGIGNCTAPNICECKSGYHSTPHGSCQPVCEKCINGQCVAPNECRCNQGYTLDQSGLCVPLCARGCGPNGKCVSPNVCSYPTTTSSSTITTPIPARPPAQPHQPQNPYYYQPVRPSYPLVPENQQQNFTNQGPELTECSLQCLNGICVEGNRCICNSGYTLDRTDATETRCIPYCPGGCPNGICTAPNYCICNMGYYKDHSVKGKATCVRRIRRSVDSDTNSVFNSELYDEDKNKKHAVLGLFFEIPDY